MAAYSLKSQTILNTAEPDLITLFQEVVKEFDNTILSGMRTQQEQFDLFKQGRSWVTDQWGMGTWIITDKSKVVTYADGTTKKSKHNASPSKAIDATPYPLNWKDRDRLFYFSGFVLGTASRLLSEGKMTHRIRWGGDWDGDYQTMDETFADLCHFEIID